MRRGCSRYSFTRVRMGIGLARFVWVSCMGHSGLEKVAYRIIPSARLASRVTEPEKAAVVPFIVAAVAW